MWGPLLGLALLVAVNPVLLAVILLMISRPRPLQNLLVYWAGGMIVYLVVLLLPLVLLYTTPTFASFSYEFADPNKATTPTVRFIHIGMGVLMLVVAAVMAVRSVARQRAYRPRAGSNTSVSVLESDTPTPNSPLGALGGISTEGGSALGRLLGRLQNAWDNGSLWVAFVFGLLGLPPPLIVLFVDTTIAASGAGLATQVFAVIAFVVAVFAVVEIALLSYLIAPARTQAILRPLHDWALIHRRHVLIAIFTVVGLLQVAKGVG
ncbi:GAP family protein [Mycolicibacterium celeriflavum]|uniref:GAP family protein n=1 Tax=Mycolicibacterium celeriflavum TaxID=1249101 RepID=UPI003CF778A3